MRPMATLKLRGGLAAAAMFMVASVVAPPSRAAEPTMIAIKLTDTGVAPEEIHVPSGGPTIIEVTNAAQAANEFEMRQLAIEKLIPAGGVAKVRLRPLAPGRYIFLSEFHDEGAQGVIVADPPVPAPGQ